MPSLTAAGRGAGHVQENQPLLTESSSQTRRPQAWPPASKPLASRCYTGFSCRGVLSLVILFVTYVVNQADRWLLPVVAPAGMRCHLRPSNCTLSTKNSTAEHDCQGDCVDFDDYDQGILTGPAFCAVYVLAGLPLSRLADTKSRTLVLIIGMIGWSSMVVATGFVRSTWQLYLTRVGLGIGEVRHTTLN